MSVHRVCVDTVYVVLRGSKKLLKVIRAMSECWTCWRADALIACALKKNKYLNFHETCSTVYLSIIILSNEMIFVPT